MLAHGIELAADASYPSETVLGAVSVLLAAKFLEATQRN
jgi:hypothetical protein